MNALEAKVAARKADNERALVRSWNAAALTGAAFAGKLKSLDYYLNAGKPDQSRGGAALLGALLAMKRKGVKMKVERVER